MYPEGLDKSALPPKGFRLTSVWKLLFFLGRHVCFFVPRDRQSGVRTSVGKRASVSGPHPSSRAACPEQLRSVQVSFLQGGRCSLGTPAPFLFWPTVLSVSFTLMYGNEPAPLYFSKLKSKICRNYLQRMYSLVRFKY